MTTRLTPSPAIRSILDAARWAPSGDNAQPWSFEVQGENSVLLRIHLAENVYEYRGGEPTLISAGALLENVQIAAPGFGKKASWKYLGQSSQTHLIALSFEDMLSPLEHELATQILKRSVDRRAYKLRALTLDQKSALSRSVDRSFSVRWHDGLSARWKVSALCRLATDIRLRIPETFAIHNRIVDWDRRDSPHAIPSRALGLDSLTLLIMRWSLARRSRTELTNRLGSPLFASMQMDLLPGVFSASYFTLEVPQRSPDPQAAVIQLLNAGQSIQRFWLSATELGLVLQPCLAMLAFSHYGNVGEMFSVNREARLAAARLAGRFREAFPDPSEILFAGRIGWPRSAMTSRSSRVPLDQLLIAGPDE